MRALDGARARAIELRLQQWSSTRIAAELGVAPSTAYLWTKHIPLDRTPEEAAGRRRRHMEHMREARWRPHRAARDAERAVIKKEAIEWVAGLSSRDVVLAGAVAYWCEGTKEKPWRQTSTSVQFINGDLTLILLFLRFMEECGYPRSSLHYRISIHETADPVAAIRSWAGDIGVPAESFRKSTLKRHNPSTVRKNVDDSYRGCLVVYAPKSDKLYRRVEGILEGVAAAVGMTRSG